MKRVEKSCLFSICFVLWILSGSVFGLDSVEPVMIKDSWAKPVPPMRLDFGYDPDTYETSFGELRPGRLSPLNTWTSVGVPGFPVMDFSYLMRVRYGEFDLRFTTETDKGEKFVHIQPNFKLSCLGNWYPSGVARWDSGGIHYEVSYAVIPNKPQPVDLFKITMKNSSDGSAKGNLLVTLDGAPTLQAEGNLISDHGKPLIVMDPAVPVQRIARESGCVDPRTTPSGTYRGHPHIDEWHTNRNGWYGMPIEYLLKVSADEKLKVFLGFDGTPDPSPANWDVKREEEYPEVIDVYTAPFDREVIAVVEGDADEKRIPLPGAKRVVKGFVGTDSDGDGYIKISVRATPQSRQPAVLSLIWAFDPAVTVTEADLVVEHEPAKAVRVVNEMYEYIGPDDRWQDRVRYLVDVGRDNLRDCSTVWRFIGTDPTVYALQLRYQPELAAGEEKTYLLRLPTIDKPETAPYGNAWRPYDTGETWKPYLDLRHPENKTPYGEDVPVGTDPADYAMYGPKSRKVWEKQLQAASSISWDQAMKRLSEYWETFVERRAKYVTPEPFIDDLYKHQIASLHLHRLKFSNTDYEIQLTGPSWYWDIAISRDVPYMYLAYDYAGLHDIAESLWNTAITPRSELPRARWTVGQWDDPQRDGLFVTRTGQWDGQGQFLWGLANHYLMTGDEQWLKKYYPAIQKGADCVIRFVEQEKKRFGNPEAIGYGMLPPATPEAGGPGHNYYVSSFNILGLNMAARIAELKGKDSDARRWRKQAEEMQQATMKAIQYSFFRYNDFAGTIPFGPEWLPGPEWMKEKDGRMVCMHPVDTNFGCPLVWPTEAVAPFDPMMNAWFRNREHLARESKGIYGWTYIAVDNALSYIRRGEPDRAADWFYIYANAANTCLDWGEGVDTNALFSEFDPPRRGIRTGGMSPHGWASAFYVSFLRNLMINEQDNMLHIAPATPRQWLAQPQPIGVEDAPSFFGPVTYHLTADPDKTTIRGEVKLSARRKPKKLLIHVRGPGGRGLQSVKLNGKDWHGFHGDLIIVPEPDNKIILEAKYAGN